jgi:hypothetical protein
MTANANSGTKLIRVVVVCGIVLGLLLLLFVPFESERYERALFSGNTDQIRAALQVESHPNRFVYPLTLENRLRRLFGFGLVGRTHPMLVALENGSIEAVRELAAGGVDVNGHDGTGYRALALAAHRGDVKVSEALLDLGADPNLRWKDGTPIHQDATPAIRKLFVKRGVRLIP